VPFGDVAALRVAVGPQTAAVIVEPALGEGGVVPAPAGFLADVRKICTEAGALMIVDEVQSGIGRTGHWFASQAEGVRPDVITLAKGLGGGLPIGACLGVGAAGALFSPGDHGSTFGGNPVSCAASLAVLTTIADEHLLDQVKRVGEHLAHALDGLDSPLIGARRGVGLWRAIALTEAKAGAVEAAARERGLLVNAVKADVVRLVPPLILTEADVDDAIPRLAEALANA
jgi:acetylornithine aminotransferase